MYIWKKDLYKTIYYVSFIKMVVSVQRLNRNKETKHKKLKQDWASSLKKYRSEFSSVELQKKALDWRIK